MSDPAERALEVVRQATARAGRAGDVPAPDERWFDDASQELVPIIAGRHRIGGSVLRGLDGVTVVAGPVRDELDAQRRRWRLHHLTTVRAVHELAGPMDARGVRWLVFKGPALAGSVYPDPGDRAYGDVDLLIHPSDLGAAVRVLESLGYRHGNHHWRHAAWIRRAEFPMRRADVDIDVHWHVQYSRHERADLMVDVDALHRRTRRATIAGVDVAVPSAEDALVLTAHHACRSGGHRLVWSKDLERLLSEGGADLDVVVRIATESNLRGQVAVAIARSAAALSFDAADLLGALDSRVLLLAEASVTRCSAPFRPEEAPAAARRWASSVRGTPLDTATYVARRAANRLRALGGAPESVPDDEGEKQEFLDLVAEWGRQPGTRR